MLLLWGGCRQLILFMQAECKPEKSRLLYFLKQAGQQLRSASRKEREHLKVMVKADKMTNCSEEKSRHFPDANHLLRREIQKKRYDEVYRNADERNAAVKQGKDGQRIGILIMKSQAKREGHLESIDEEQASQRNKLYQIPITSNRLKQKCDKNGISFIRFAAPAPTPSEQNPSLSTISHNFNTYFQFKQFMSKISSDCRQGKTSTYRGLNSNVHSSKKCSIMPALKPTLYKPKTNNHSFNSNSKIEQNQEYLQTKRTKIRLEQSLMVESKRQELATHVVTRHRETKSKIEDEGNDETIEESSLSKISPFRKQHDTLSPKLSQTQRSKKKHISFSFSSHNQQGVYQQKMRSYRQLLFLVNLAHRVFDPLVILDGTVIRLEKTPIVRPTYYVGPGNNAMLVRSLMKRRIWWEEVSDYRNANFVWTQLKIPAIYENQKKTEERTYEEALQQPEISPAAETKQQSASVSPPRKFRRKLKSSMEHINVEKVLTTQKCNYSIYEGKKESAGVPKGVMFKAPFAVSAQSKLLSKDDAKYYLRMMDKVSKGDFDSFESRLKHLPKDYLQLRSFQQELQVHNHLECNHSLGNKKALFYHMQLYYTLTNKPINKAFPQTYHIRTGETDPQFKKFLLHHQQIAKSQKDCRNIWILKPGENSNRGSGITVIKQISELRKLLRNRERHRNGQSRTFILQRYIERPLLYRGRKFDLRHYMIISGLHGRLRAYWYGEGYVRTSSYLFSLQETSDPMVHLTNDAIQKDGEDYGCHEEGNKVSYNQLQKYFATELPQKGFDFSNIFGKMRDLAKDAVCATYVSLDPQSRLHNFEVFGLDFMIDEDLEVMLIEVNTNPCLELSSGLLSRIIPLMLDQAFRIGLDPLFPPQVHYSNNTKHLAPDCSLEKLQLELIFDSARDGRALAELYHKHSEEYMHVMGLLQGSEKELDEVYESEGAEIETDTLIY